MTYRQALKAIGLTEPQYIKAVQFFDRNGIDLGWVNRRGFRFCSWHTGVEDFPLLIVWCGSATVRSYLDAPQDLFADFAVKLISLREHAERVKREEHQ